MQEQQDFNFLSSLFDFSFSRFISVELVRVLYILALLLDLILTVIGVFAAFTNGFLAGIFGLVVAPVFFLVFAVAARVSLEFMVVVFRIADHTRKIAERVD